MKIKYKDIVGHLVIEEYAGACSYCCFNQMLYCIPSRVWRCVDTIFEESKSQVFEL